MKLVSAALVGFALASPGRGDTKTVTLAEAARHAVEQSQIAAPGSTPFHLKASVVETTNPASEYKAEIEEFWISPEKWRRTVTSPTFSQTLIVNGDKTFEVDKGDYFPWWLNDLVTALFDPLPMLEALKDVNSQIRNPGGGENSTSCARLQVKVGTPVAENSAFLVFCFEGSRGLLESVVTPGYDAEFRDYKDFKKKHVSRRITIDPEPGTTIEAKVTELSELGNIDESLFTAQDSTPARERLRSVVVPESAARGFSVATPDVLWPTVRSGKTSGVLSLYVSIDRNGHVREAWPLNSDNAGLDDAARKQVLKWEFKPAGENGAPVQIGTTLTLAFNTKIGDPIPILTDEEARKLATNVVEPVFPAGTAKGTVVKIEVGVSLDGTINGAGNPDNAPTPLFMAAYNAVRQWRFRRYVRDGKPDLFGADLIFRAP
jgi:TonB family protein